ncbi:orf30 [Lactobacillus phage LP65]|uniref:Orf30 n=1 Tax=Lactobacillus phage LP65 TaxID=2892344 RepID=Q5ULT4_9CAUD|nr:hypothetical protein LP65_gp030 [Lactobacillus phage LP65]AAV35850.1 orf30 [Lactobacillus phage LP65]
MSYAESMIKKYRDTENKSVGLYSTVLKTVSEENLKAVYADGRMNKELDSYKLKFPKFLKSSKGFLNVISYDGKALKFYTEEQVSTTIRADEYVIENIVQFYDLGSQIINYSTESTRNLDDIIALLSKRG